MHFSSTYEIKMVLGVGNPQAIINVIQQYVPHINSENSPIGENEELNKLGQVVHKLTNLAFVLSIMLLVMTICSIFVLRHAIIEEIFPWLIVDLIIVTLIIKLLGWKKVESISENKGLFFNRDPREGTFSLHILN